MANLVLRSLAGRMTMRTRRDREKFCFILILFSFFAICFGMVFFLPDLRARTTTGVHEVYEKLPDLFLGAHLPPPPILHSEDAQNENENQPQNVVPRPLNPPPRREEDRAKLYAKIQEEEEELNRKAGILPKPKIVNSKSSSSTTTTTVAPESGINDNKKVQSELDNILLKPHQDDDHQQISNNEIEQQMNNDFDEGVQNQNQQQVRKDPVAISVKEKEESKKGLANPNEVLIQGGEDSEPSIRSKRDFIKQQMKDAWDNYVKYAWGDNELKPTSKRGHSASIFGPTKIGATIIDALDTLYIMGLDEEYQAGRDWVEKNLNFDNIRVEVSVFETNIRFVGGLLTCYALTGDTMFREKAHKLATKLLPAFDTPTGIPMALINLHSGQSKNYGWASSGSSILSEFGTLHLEFLYLSEVTGDPIFKSKIDKIRETMRGIEKPKGLYSNYVHPRMGKFTQSHVSMGALGDSFYEYLLKASIQSHDPEARKLYDDAMDAFEQNGLIRFSKEGLLYFAEMRYDRIDSKMDHLACFAGGLLALGAHTLGNKTGENSVRYGRHMEMARGITNTCHESYIRTATRLGPESFRFNDAMEARALRQNEKYYILRPEVIESYFVLWRITGDQKYRDWGWDAAQAIEEHCKAGPGLGYAGIRNVYSKEVSQDDVQQSFFLAETLKYLYLLFSSNDLIDLNYWVFNTEAHPFPVKATNPLYREFKE